jgi:hypothetical protein
MTSFSLTLRALWELSRYDLSRWLFGTQGIYEAPVRRPGSPASTLSSETEESICRAMRMATVVYWKRVRCLQYSVATARMLWRCRANAEVVIGYRPAPLFLHSWVEVDGRVVNGSAAYRKHLLVLDRISPQH